MNFILQGDLDEMASEAHLSDDKAKKAMVDAARLADELRNEQEIALCHEKDRKLLECQTKDMQIRLDEAEVNALKGGKKAMNKMETRIRFVCTYWAFRTVTRITIILPKN